MTLYRNFTVVLPERIQELDREFMPIAKSKDLEVSYLLMKLAASFLLPYERVQGTSGASSSDINDRQEIRKYLELDKQFRHATYCGNDSCWYKIEVDDFTRGPRGWEGMEQPLDDNIPAHKVLAPIRHAVAHSNLYFGGETEIEHVYFGSRRDKGTDKYLVIRCRICDMKQLLDSWIANLEKMRVSPALIWDELETAA